MPDRAHVMNTHNKIVETAVKARFEVDIFCASCSRTLEFALTATKPWVVFKVKPCKCLTEVSK